MRKLILQMQMSVDGFVSTPDASLDWLVWNFSDHFTWDAKLQEEFNRICATIGGVVLSGNMGAEGYIDHWTRIANKHADEPKFAFAQKIKQVPKFIFSNRIKRSLWDNTSIIDGDLKEEVTSLKSGNGKDLICFGGASFARALLTLRLVDELQLFVNPVVLGSGISIFRNITDLKLQLVGAKAYTCGITVLKYGWRV